MIIIYYLFRILSFYYILFIKLSNPKQILIFHILSKDFMIQQEIQPNQDFIVPEPMLIQQVKLISQNQIKNLLSKQKLVCCYQNPATTLCLNVNCLNGDNPFICSIEKCQCSDKHQNCNEKRIKLFLKSFQNKQKIIGEIQNMINSEVDKIIDYISILRDDLIKNLKKGKFFARQNKQLQNQYSKQNRQNNQIQNLVQLNKNQQIKPISQLKDLNSKILYQTWKHFKDVELLYHPNQILNYIQPYRNSQIKMIDQYFQDVQQNLKISSLSEDINRNITQLVSQRKIGHIKWDQNFKAANHIIFGLDIRRYETQNQSTLSFLSPSLNQIKGQIIGLRIMILSFKKNIKLGIGLKKHLKKNNFVLTDTSNANHGVYMLSGDGNLLTHKNTLENNKQDILMAFRQGDTICIQFNRMVNPPTLCFINERSNQIRKIQVTHKIKNDQDEYGICVMLGGGDDVMIESPLRTNRGIYIEQK